MKTLFIIRHAKAETVFTLNDFERPLNERGKKDAPEMAKRLLHKKIKIDGFVSSPATRAKQTAESFAAAYDTKKGDVIFISALYQAPPEVFFEVIAGLDDALNRVAIFAHNPGITLFVNELVAQVKIENLPTCGVFAVQADIDRWTAFDRSKKEFLFFAGLCPWLYVWDKKHTFQAGEKQPQYLLRGNLPIPSSQACCNFPHFDKSFIPCSGWQAHSSSQNSAGWPWAWSTPSWLVT